MTNTTADTTVRSSTLLEFVNNELDDDERAEFGNAWPWYIRQVMGVTRESRHVWPYNIDFALRATLANVASDSSNLDETLEIMDERNRNTDGFDNVLGTIADTLGDARVKDPYAFPDD